MGFLDKGRKKKARGDDDDEMMSPVPLGSRGRNSS